MSGFRLLQRVRNTVASERNPHRDGYYLRTITRTGRVNAGRWAVVLCDDGMEAEVRPDNLMVLPDEHAALLEVEKAAREVEKCINSDVIFEDMREAWGNTNTYIWRRAIKANGAALAALDRVREGEG